MSKVVSENPLEDHIRRVRQDDGYVLQWSVEYLHGRRQSIRLCSWPLAMAVRVLVKYASGSTSFKLLVSMSEAMVAQLSAPTSSPAKVRSCG